MNIDHWIQAQLEKRVEDHLLREIHSYPSTGGHLERNGAMLLNLSSNDYLNLANNAALIQASTQASDRLGTGSTASRLITGSLELHDQLEKEIAKLKGYEDCLLFGSGYLANVGLIPALVDRYDTIYADRLIHACMIDGAKISGATIKRFKHNDPAHLEKLLSKHEGQGKKIVLVESVYSMEGDLAPLKELAAIADQYEAALIVDEAHATGVFGPNGAGLSSTQNLQNNIPISMGTLSKGLGGYGGFIACSSAMKSHLVNNARAFIYTTALPPSVVAAALASLKFLRKDASAGQTLLDRSEKFRSQLNKAGLDTSASQSQIVPIMVGDNERCMRIMARLKAENILAVAIRPPTVPPNLARIRCSLTLAHSEEELQQAAETLIRIFKEEMV